MSPDDALPKWTQDARMLVLPNGPPQRIRHQRMIRDNSGFIFRAKHPDGSAVTTGLDPVIGQNTPGTARVGMDEPAPNHPTGNVRSTLNQPNAFVVPTGGAYFFVPSISALQQEIFS